MAISAKVTKLLDVCILVFNPIKLFVLLITYCKKKLRNEEENCHKTVNQMTICTSS